MMPTFSVEYLSDHFVKSQRKTTSLCLFGQNKQALCIKFEGYFGRFLATTIMKLKQLRYKRASLPSLLCPVEELKGLWVRLLDLVTIEMKMDFVLLLVLAYDFCISHYLMPQLHFRNWRIKISFLIVAFHLTVIAW